MAWVPDGDDVPPAGADPEAVVSGVVLAVVVVLPPGADSDSVVLGSASEEPAVSLLDAVPSPDVSSAGADAIPLSTPPLESVDSAPVPCSVTPSLVGSTSRPVLGRSSGAEYRFLRFRLNDRIRQSSLEGHVSE